MMVANTRQKLFTREKLLAVAAALALVLLMLLPYALGYLTARPGTFFTGLLMNPEDSQTYFAKMLQGYNGRFLYTIPFTPEAHDAAFVGVFYVWLGHLARLLGLSLTALWHGARVVADLILFFVTYRFIAAFFSRAQARWVAYLLALFGAGLGWLLFLAGEPYWLGAFPVDFKQPGAHLFFSAFTFPHVALGTALTMLSVWGLWRMGEKRPSRAWRYAIITAMVHVGLGIAYPFLIYLVATIAGLYWLYLAIEARRILWQRGFIFAVSFLIPLPLYLYYAYILRVNPVFRAWDVQAVTPSPPWPHYLLAYGPMLLLAFIHWRRKPRERPHFAILWLWVLAVALLVYAPLNPQRRFVQGVHVPLSILSTAAFLGVLLPWLRQTRGFQKLIAHPRYETERLSRLIVVIFLAFMSLSNLYVLVSVSVSAVIQQPDPIFRPQDEIVVTQWLRDHSDQSAVVLGHYQTGNYVAAHAGRRVVLGHWAETVDYEAKKEAVARFYKAATPDAWRRDFLARYGITYVWVGPRERALGEFDAQTAAYLQPVFSHNTITLYAVTAGS